MRIDDVHYDSCEDCDGTGMDAYEQKICKTCKGTGWVASKEDEGEENA